MALPFGPYEGQDLTQYQAGNKFLPRQFYSLDFPDTPPPSVANTPTGITNTQAAGSYMGYPSYEAWLLAQGGGGDGGNDPVDNINRGGVNQNLGSTNITDYESEAYGVGPTFRGSIARLQDLYSKLPTPGNLIMKGIRHWKQRREDKRAEDAAIEQARIDQISQQSQANAAAAGGGGAQSGITASTTAAQAAGMGGGSRQATSAGSTNSGRTDGGWGWAQGGRIGYKERGFVDPEEVDDLSIFELMKDQGIEYDQMAEAVNQQFPSDALGAINLNEEQMTIISDLNDKMETPDISLISTISGAAEDAVGRFIRLLNAKAQGGSVGYSNGGLASIV
jgi:hypothetical protein